MKWNFENDVLDVLAKFDDMQSMTDFVEAMINGLVVHTAMDTSAFLSAKLKEEEIELPKEWFAEHMVEYMRICGYSPADDGVEH